MWGNPKLIQWDYGKEINITLEDALMSLESLRFMLGGTIKKSSAADTSVIVRHTEEVVVDSAGKVPAPKDHLTGKVLYPKATYGHPIRLINLGGGENSATAGTRSQIVVATAEGAAQTMGALNTIKFKNPAAGVGVPPRSAQSRQRRDEVNPAGIGNRCRQRLNIRRRPDGFQLQAVANPLNSRAADKDAPFQSVTDFSVSPPRDGCQQVGRRPNNLVACIDH